MLEGINAARGQEAFTLAVILDDPTRNVAGHEMSGYDRRFVKKCRRLPARRHEDPGTTGRPEPSRLSEHGEASG